MYYTDHGSRGTNESMRLYVDFDFGLNIFSLSTPKDFFPIFFQGYPEKVCFSRFCQEVSHTTSGRRNGSVFVFVLTTLPIGKDRDPREVTAFTPLHYPIFYRLTIDFTPVNIRHTQY